ncbi:MAG TPA: DEAD/DEAH box helicase [Candidatus Peribacteraceae bacterium]|nr:DEAD/DEAH box helicase [Candidatus Peribacteraceae bacterium]
MIQQSDFQSLGVAPILLTILQKRGITTPTPIQHQSIQPAIAGKDIVGIAQTGTGKTFAFGLPMLQRLAAGKGRGLVILPTRELALQVEEALLPFATPLGIRMAVLIGGEPMSKQLLRIRRDPRIVIATPGRLNDHLERRSITLKEVNILVLDEADRMFDMGFRPQIEQILRHVSKDRQTMLFSATMPAEIMQLARGEMKLPLRIEVAPQGTTVKDVEQELFMVQRNQKLPLLKSLLAEYHGTILVFSRTKHGAKKITTAVRAMGHSAAEIHSNRSLSQRKEALAGFKVGRYRVLVATDIAARGIDVSGIEVVINFDLPDDPSDYVHRIGRTARAGRQGRAISFATGEQHGSIRDIERLIRSTIRRKPAPGLPGVAVQIGHYGQRAKSGELPHVERVPESRDRFDDRPPRTGQRPSYPLRSGPRPPRRPGRGGRRSFGRR